MTDQLDPELLPPELMVDTPPLTDADLRAYFDSMEPEYDREGTMPEEVLGREHVRSWQITDHGAAQWAGALLALAEADMRPNEELATYWHQRIDAWLADATKEQRRTAELMRAKLEDYALRIRAAGGPATITLPSVVLRTTKAEPKVEVADDETVAAYLERLFHWAFSDPEDEPALLCEDPVTPEYATWMAQQEHRQAVAAAIVEALGEATPADVVKRAPKVYVGPFRRLVHLGHVSTGWRARVELECEHWADGPCSGLDDPELPAIGAVVTCQQCEPDAIEGAPERHVADVTVYEETEPAVFGPDGLVVPGTEVNPGGLTPKAVAR